MKEGTKALVVEGVSKFFGGVRAVEAFIHVKSFRLLGNFQGFPEKFSRHQNGFLNLLIAGAAADISPDCFLYIRNSRIGIHIQQCFGADNHARNAESALNGPCRRKTILINFPLSLA